MDGNTVKITCQGAVLVNIDDLNELQEGTTPDGEKWSLKDLTDENYLKLRQSIFEHGFSFPIFFWSDETGKKWILDAHQRMRVLKKMREEGFIIPLLPADPIQADNKEHAKKKLLLLNSPYGKMTQEGFDTFVSDINLEDISDMLVLPDVMYGDPEPETQEDTPPAIDEQNTYSELGKMYQLGRHRLMCGDATKIEDVEKLMNGQRADMVFTDPPYLMGFEGNVCADGSKIFNASHGAIKNDKMSKEEGDQFIYDMFTTIKTFNKGAYYVCFYRLGLNYIFRALDKHNNDYKALIIWDKGNHTLSNSDYMSRYEPIIYGWFNDHKFYGGRSNFDIWSIERTQKNELHPTMKPIALCANAIKNSSVQDDTVLDLFGGSGSTLIACEQTNRTCYTLELDEKYVDVIRKRYWKFTTGSEEGWLENTPEIA